MQDESSYRKSYKSQQSAIVENEGLFEIDMEFLDADEKWVATGDGFWDAEAEYKIYLETQEAA
jgi:hypothetical protein